MRRRYWTKIDDQASLNGMHVPKVEGEEECLSKMLKRRRLSIDSCSESLGPYSRWPARLGKPVTQEEIAEAVGISRQWYSQLEGDRPTRVSVAVLARIADVLMMDSDERATLFRIALPELRSILNRLAGPGA